MSDEWTVKTLKQYFDRRFTDNDKAVNAAFLAQKEAITKAETATEKRFDAVNGVRDQLAYQQNTILPRAEAEVRFSGLAEKIEASSKVIGDLRSRLDVGNPVVSQIQNQIANRTGMDEGKALTRADMYRALGLIVAVASLIILFVAYFIFRK